MSPFELSRVPSKFSNVQKGPIKFSRVPKVLSNFQESQVPEPQNFQEFHRIIKGYYKFSDVQKGFHQMFKSPKKSFQIFKSPKFLGLRIIKGPYNFLMSRKGPIKSQKVLSNFEESQRVPQKHQRSL